MSDVRSGGSASSESERTHAWEPLDTDEPIIDWTPTQDGSLNTQFKDGQLVRFQSGNVYRYDPNGPGAKDDNLANMPRPWSLVLLVDPDRTPAKQIGDRVH